MDVESGWSPNSETFTTGVQMESKLVTHNSFVFMEGAS
jgi:hypothetical protein